MNPRELVDHIRSGPAELVLLDPLRFRRRTRSNPCDFNEFLQALQTSETIRTIKCRSHYGLGIMEDEWVLLVERLGRIRGIQNLEFYHIRGSRDFHPFQAFADAVSNAQSLRKLYVSLKDGETVPRDPSGLTALANALREHTALEEFTWIDWRPLALSDLALDPVLRALSACPHLQYVTIKTDCASADAVKNLLQLRPATNLYLVLETYQWLAVADEIRQGRCNVQRLTLVMIQVTKSEASETVKALATAIRLDQKLKDFTLRMKDGFTDEAGVALAEALTVNKTLRKITLFTTALVGNRNTDLLGANTYEAFSAMLRVNTSLLMELSPFDDAGADERIVDFRNQMRIEQGLNKVGRGRLLASNQTPRQEWVDALDELNSSLVDETPEFNVSCLYSLLQLHPDVCMS
jgi:hypothetical protein